MATQTGKPGYPKFNHNGVKVAAYCDPSVQPGDKGNLSYTVDGRGNGRYHFSAQPPMVREIRENNVVSTPDKTGTVVSIYRNGVVWVERDI